MKKRTYLDRIFLAIFTVFLLASCTSVSFSVMNESTDEVFKTELTKAVSGLLFSSESDYPFEIIENSAQQNPALLKEVEFEHFIERLTAEQDWFGEEEKAKAARYLVIEKLLKDKLNRPESLSLR